MGINSWLLTFGLQLQKLRVQAVFFHIPLALVHMSLAKMSSSKLSDVANPLIFYAFSPQQKWRELHANIDCNYYFLK